MQMLTKLEETRRSGLVSLLKNTGFEVSAIEADEYITITAEKEFKAGNELYLEIDITRPAKRLVFRGRMITRDSDATERKIYLRSLDAIEKFIKGHWVNG